MTDQTTPPLVLSTSDVQALATARAPAFRAAGLVQDLHVAPPRTYSQRIADAGALGVELWAAIKHARDAARARAHDAQVEYERLDALLAQMKDAGLAAHLPTIDEVREEWRAMRD